MWNIVVEKYLDPTYGHHSATDIQKHFVSVAYSDTAEAYDAARAMLQLLGDPLTRFLEPAQLASAMQELRGETADIGFADPWTLRDEKSGPLKVLHFIAGSPAFRVQVHPGDLIEAIDGAPTKSLTLDDAITRTRGRAHTTVEVSIRRGRKLLSFRVARDVLTLHTVNGALESESGIQFGYVALSQFGKDSPLEMRNAVADMLKSKADGIVLDLRNNPGGFLPASREIAGLFLLGKADSVRFHRSDRVRESAREHWARPCGQSPWSLS